MFNKWQEDIVQSDNVHVVTGAYGFPKIHSQAFLVSHQVRTLTNSINRENPFGDEVKPIFNFDDKDKMIESLQVGLFYTIITG
jgi:hypothetical protein